MKKVLLFMLVMLFVFLAFGQNFTAIVAVTPNKIHAEKPDTSVFERLDAYEAADVEKVIRQAEIERQKNTTEDKQKKKIEDTLKKLKNGKISLRKVFSDTMFVGDSLINGLEVYDILNDDLLVTQVSARLTHLEDNLKKIVSANPSELILHYGLNMLWADETGTQWFIDDYSELILKLKKALPYTRIIVSSIFPVNEEDADDEIFTHIPRHNKALKKMCEDTGVEFLDSTKLVEKSEEYYSPDGIHFNAKFYSEKWLPFIVENKGITE